MATELAKLREAVIAAAKVAVGEMQVQMAMESTNAIDNFEWKWDHTPPSIRVITDSRQLNESMEISSVVLEANRISYKIKWDPVGPDVFGRMTHYASVVHDGQRNFFEMEDNGTKDYTARPWTFLLMPPEQRDASQLYVPSGPSPQSLPDDAWKACLTAFNLTLKNQLANSFKVVG